MPSEPRIGLKVGARAGLAPSTAVIGLGGIRVGLDLASLGFTGNLISPAVSSIAPLGTVQLSSTASGPGVQASGSTASSLWISSNPVVATVAPTTGLVTATAVPGVVTITAALLTVQGVSLTGSAQVTVA